MPETRATGTRPGAEAGKRIGAGSNPPLNVLAESVLARAKIVLSLISNDYTGWGLANCNRSSLQALRH
jgi:hypothetical protein